MENKPFQYKRVKLGFAPTRKFVFSREDALKFKRIVQDKLRGWDIDLVTLDNVNSEGLLVTDSDVRKTQEIFHKEQIDAIFSPHCNFGTEDAVAELGHRLNKPLLIWGPRDGQPLEDGTRLRDTQCGLFATSKVLQRHRVPFSYIVNSSLEDEVFSRGLLNFLAAAGIVRDFKNARIGQIGVRPAPFYTVTVNESELMERFHIGIKVYDTAEFIASVRKRMKSDQVSRLAAELKKKVRFEDTTDEQVKALAAIKIEIQEWAAENNITAIAIQCWMALINEFGIMVCFPSALLTEEGLPVACECDIHGAISALLARSAAMGKTPPFFPDLTIRHPDNDNAELLWHCGPFPLSLKDDGIEPVVGKHFIVPGCDRGACHWRIKGGDVTIVRFEESEGRYCLLAGHGRGVNGPHTTGTYLWVEFNNWPEWEEKLIYGPYMQHVAAVHGKHAAALYEATRYLPGLTFDEIDPKISEIRAYLRGQGRL